MIATPALLRFAPTHFLPCLSATISPRIRRLWADHGAMLSSCGGAKFAPPTRPTCSPRALAGDGYGFIALVAPINAYVTAFIPGRNARPCSPRCWWRVLYFFADEWLTRGPGAAGALSASKLAFLVSLGFAVALNFERLFFLILIVPIIAVFFVVYGLLSGWVYARGHPFVREPPTRSRWPGDRGDISLVAG